MTFDPLTFWPDHYKAAERLTCPDCGAEPRKPCRRATKGRAGRVPPHALRVKAGIEAAR